MVISFVISFPLHVTVHRCKKQVRTYQPKKVGEARRDSRVHHGIVGIESIVAESVANGACKADDDWDANDIGKFCDANDREPEAQVDDADGT